MKQLFDFIKKLPLVGKVLMTIAAVIVFIVCAYFTSCKSMGDAHWNMEVQKLQQPKLTTVVIGSVERNSLAAWNAALFKYAPAVVTESIKIMPPNDHTTTVVGDAPGNIFDRMDRDVLQRVNHVVVMPNFGEVTEEEIAMAKRYMMSIEYLRYNQSGGIETDRFSQ